MEVNRLALEMSLRCHETMPDRTTPSQVLATAAEFKKFLLETTVSG